MDILSIAVENGTATYLINPGLTQQAAYYASEEIKSVLSQLEGAVFINRTKVTVKGEAACKILMMDNNTALLVSVLRRAYGRARKEDKARRHADVNMAESLRRAARLK